MLVLSNQYPVTSDNQTYRYFMNETNYFQITDHCEKYNLIEHASLIKQIEINTIAAHINNIKLVSENSHKTNC